MKSKLLAAVAVAALGMTAQGNAADSTISDFPLLQLAIEHVEVAMEITPEEKVQIASVLKAEIPKTKELVNQAIADKDAVAEAVIAVPYSEEDVKKACAALAVSQEKLILHGAEVRIKVRSFLTTEQLAKIDTRRDTLRGRIKTRFAQLRQALRTLISDSAQG